MWSDFVYFYVFYLLAEQMRQQQRVLRKTGRELERDRGQLDRQEKQLVIK